MTNNKLKLILSSFLMLFVELIIIRYTSANIYYLFSFANFILMASFLGMGIGFLRPSSSKKLFPFIPILFVLVIVFCSHYAVQYHVKINPDTKNIDYYAATLRENIYPIWLTLPIAFILVTALMAAIADGVKRLFNLFSALEAYRLETLGALSGIIVFSGLAFLTFQPLLWGIIVAAIFLYLNKNEKRIFVKGLQILSFIIVIFIFAKESFTANQFWSPYYKIQLENYATKSYAVKVNGLIQQIIEPAKDRVNIKPFYTLPYEHKIPANHLNRVLIIGAGTGGDVAIALAQGAKQIDAVEIDPKLYELGKIFNPDSPYNDKRVHVFINDGRAFLQQTKQQYDLIIFALTDSLMLIPGQSSLRLENFLYTIEGMQSAANHLTPSGVFAIYNYYRPEWLVNRLANMLEIVYKNPPCLDTYDAQNYWATVLTASKNKHNMQCDRRFMLTHQNYISPAHDDHPFIYLKDHDFSFLYLSFLSFIFVISLITIKYAGGSFKTIYKYLDLFLMGSAFLLLETKNVIQFALLFGTTWFVNALVFIGVLISLYLAIETAESKIKFDNKILYIALVFALFLSWSVPSYFLLHLSYFLRFMLAIILAFTPIFIANLIFANRFKQTKNSSGAFGANLLGAVLGGILEYSSLMIGYNNLLLMIIALYTLAIFLMRKRVQ